MILFLLLVCWASVSVAERKTVTDERGFVLDDSGYFASYGKTAVGYVGTEEILVIPEDIDAVVFQSSYRNEHVRVISLKYFDSSKTEFSVYSDFPNLEYFIAPDDTSSIFEVDEAGVLFEKRHYVKGIGWLGPSIVRYPAARKGAYTIPDWIHYVDGFENSTGLTAVTIPEGIDSMGFDAFSGCTALEEIHIPSTMAGISSDAFRGCTSLKTVTISEGVTYIESGAFAGCTALKTLRIPASVTDIGEDIVEDGCVLDVSKGSAGHKYAFMNHLTYTIDGEEPLDESCGEKDGFAYFVREDGNATICRCDLTGDIVIPATINGITVDNLEKELFYGRSGITSVTIPATVTFFGSNRYDNLWDYVFSYCYDLKAIHVDSSNPVFCSEDGVLFLKDKSMLINYPCARRAVSYHVQEGTSLCCTSFASAKYLRALYLDDKKTTWKTYTFYGDEDLQVYYIPGGAAETMAKRDSFTQFLAYDASVPERVLQEIVQISQAAFPDETFRKYVAEQFDENQNQWLDELEILDADEADVSNMGIADLEGVRYLSSLRYLYCNNNSLTSLDVSGMSSLKQLYCYGNSLISMDVSGCTSLSDLYCYDNSLTSLDLSSMDKNPWVYADNNVRQVLAGNCEFQLDTLPGFDVSRAGNWAGGTVDGTVLTVQKSGIVTYTYDCGNGISLDFKLKVTVPWDTTGITVIYPPTEDTEGCYQRDLEGPIITYYVPSLKEMDVLKLPSSLKTIEAEAFANMPMEAVIVPDGCTVIESGAFRGCPNLVYIRIPEGVRIADDAFQDSPNVAIDLRTSAQETETSD